MINLGVDLFSLAKLQLIKERKPYTMLDIINYAVIIRRYLDVQEERTEKTQFKKLS